MDDRAPRLSKYKAAMGLRAICCGSGFRMAVVLHSKSRQSGLHFLIQPARAKLRNSCQTIKTLVAPSRSTIPQPVNELLEDYTRFIESNPDHVINSALKKLWRDQDYRKWHETRRTAQPGTDKAQFTEARGRRESS